MSPLAMPRDFVIDDYDVDAFATLAAHFGQDRYGYAVTPNADHLIRWHQDATFRDYYADATYALMDSRIIGGLLSTPDGARAHVCPGSDLTERLLDSVVAADDRIVLIGSEDSQASRLVERYGLKNLHHFNPPMGFADDPEAVEACLRFIESHSPFRFCLLAVGAPRQEMLANALRVRGVARGLALCVGAAIDFLTGKEQRAPRWVQQAGFEWLFRLSQQPSRLAYRYLVRGPRVFFLLPRTRLVLRPPQRSTATAELSKAVGAQ